MAVKVAEEARAEAGAVAAKAAQPEIAAEGLNPVRVEAGERVAQEAIGSQIFPDL